VAEPLRQDATVHELQPATVPYTRFQAVSEALIREQEDRDVLKDTLRTYKRQLGQAKAELKRLLAEYADDDEVVEFLAWWAKSSGRGPRTDITPTSDRAEHYRKLRKRKRTRREIATMVLGARNHHFPPFRKRDDLEDLARSTKWAEECLEIGEKILAEREQAA
jgi:hypothetical protein